MNFETAFDNLLGHEGGYTNNPADPGKETIWGITKKVAVENGYTGLMQVMPKETAQDIYKRKYWDAIKAEQLPPDVRYIVFDSAVNSGVGQAVKWLQAACGANIDGILGPQTIQEANTISPDGIKRRFLAKRLRFMTELPTWPTFSRGWARRICDLMEV